MRHSILFIVRGGATVPSTRFRAMQYRQHLELLGVKAAYLIIEPSKNPFKQFIFHLKLLILPRFYSAVIYLKLLEPFRLRLAKLANKNLYFDFDDAMYISESESRFRKTMEAAPNVIAGNSLLAAKASQYHSNVMVIPTTVEPGKCMENIYPSKIVFSWMGTASNLVYLEPVIAALTQLQPEIGFFNLDVLTDRPDKVPQEPWIKPDLWDLQKESSHLQRCTIGLMPLTDNEWSRGKCACKALQYLSYNKPVITSNVGVNGDIFSRDALGTLVDGSNWSAAITLTLTRLKAGFFLNTARYDYIVDNYSTGGWAQQLAGLCQA